jgi:hypothetical protein
VSPSPADALSEEEALKFLHVLKPLTAKPPQPREVVPSASADFAVPTKQQGGTDSETSQAFNGPLLAPPASLPAKARERALKAVRGPARGLIVTCVLNIPVVLVAFAAGRPDLVNTLGLLLALVLCGCLLAGTQNMLNLEHYGFCVFTSIIAIFSCSGLGIIFGSMALGALLRKDVKSAFH